jgi:uncharacterized membrane protein YqiK
MHLLCISARRKSISEVWEKLSIYLIEVKMDTLLNIFKFWWVLVVLWMLLASIKFIPNNAVGIVEKRFGGKRLKKGFIALEGEAGFQPDLLRGGLHFLIPIMYVVHRVPLVTISQGKIGYVFARDGENLPADQTLASNVTANNFQDVRDFLTNGGQRGPQRLILREGTYAINLVQFIVFTEEKVYSLSLSSEEKGVIANMGASISDRQGYHPIVIRDDEDLVGIVTVHDGASLPTDEIIAPIVGNNPTNLETYHNSFQNPDKFLLAKGMRGRQLQVLVEGTYYINRLFATIDFIEKTVIEVGYVGVVVSYTGTKGEDTSGEDYKHGELVAQGSRGVWADPLLPGKYAFNTYAGKVVAVPTTNIILKWIHNEKGSHNLDENLAEVSLITKDAFEPSLPLSVVIHIDYKKAPLVVQRFGDVKKLVEQTLDPMVAAYFKNIGQTRTLIELIQGRSEIQNLASSEMRSKFEHYNLEMEEVLIGTPSASEGDKQIEAILNQLRDRQIAEEKVGTYSKQQIASTKERELREAQAKAEQQAALTASEIDITVQANKGKAAYQNAIQQAATVKTLAEAEAERIARTGIAQAIATEEQVRAYGGAKYQVTSQVLTRFSEAVEKSGISVVPTTLISGGGNTEDGGINSNIMSGLLAMLLSNKMGMEEVNPVVEKNPMVEKLRKEISEKMAAEEKDIESKDAENLKPADSKPE